MRRKRATGRFYVFLLLLAVILFLILRPYLGLGSKEAVIMTANSEYKRMMDCVIIRDESVMRNESVKRIEYIANENTLVNQGDPVVNIYTSGYTSGLLTKLEETRSSIQEYHKNTILNDIKDADLERYDTIVDMMVQEFKQLVNHKSKGSILTAAQQLETAMVNRQEYLRANKREDTKLAKLYDEESTRLSSIAAWRMVQNAPRSGVVSFYTDGFEDTLNADQIQSISPSQIRNVLNARKGVNPKATSSDLYRLVNQENWYVAVVSNAKDWNPVVGQEYFLQLQGFDDLAFNAYVSTVQKENDSILAIYRIEDPIGPLIYQRTGKATLTTMISGLSVNSKALSEQNGQTGVWLYDVPGGTFVPVEVLSDDGKTALIQPLAEGAISVGQRVLIK